MNQVTEKNEAFEARERLQGRAMTLYRAQFPGSGSTKPLDIIRIDVVENTSPAEVLITLSSIPSVADGVAFLKFEKIEIKKDAKNLIVTITAKLAANPWCRLTWVETAKAGKFYPSTSQMINEAWLTITEKYEHFDADRVEFIPTDGVVDAVNQARTKKSTESQSL